MHIVWVFCAVLGGLNTWNCENTDWPTEVACWRRVKVWVYEDPALVERRGHAQVQCLAQTRGGP